MGKAAGCERSPARGPSLLGLQGPPASLCLLTHSPPVSSGANGQTFPSSNAAMLLASTPGRPRLTHVHQPAVLGRQARWDVRVSHISPHQPPHRSSVWISKGSVAQQVVAGEVGPQGPVPAQEASLSVFSRLCCVHRLMPSANHASQEHQPLICVLFATLSLAESARQRAHGD